MEITKVRRTGKDDDLIRRLGLQSVPGFSLLARSVEVGRMRLCSIDGCIVKDDGFAAIHDDDVFGCCYF